MNKDKIIDEAKFYINSNLNEREAAKELGISRKTLQIHLTKIGLIDPFLYDLVLKKKESNMAKGRIRGGQIGKSHPRYTREDAMRIARGIILNHYTYEEASKVYGIPKSTIYEMVHSDFVSDIVKIELEGIANSNNKEKNASGK